MAKPSRKVPPDDREATAAQIIEPMMTAGRAQFGDAVRAYWVYAADLCPGCLKRPIDVMKYKVEWREPVTHSRQPDSGDLSLFQLGLRLLDYFLTHEHPISSSFNLAPKSIR